MSTIGLLFTLIAAVSTLCLPRVYAVVPLLMAAAYMPIGETLQINGAIFTIPRILVAIGFLRILLRSERLAGRWTTTDRLVLLWGALLIATSAFHTDDAWLYRSGIVWSELGSYFLIRNCLRDANDARRLLVALCFLLLPLAALMIAERQTGIDFFGSLENVNAIAAVREGQVRASGPFSHPILAGTVGAALLGYAISLRSEFRFASIVAGIAGCAMVYASGSSGPLLMAAATLMACAAWPLRHRMRRVWVVILLLVVVLDLVMNDPVYFLMAKIDLVGGSQGYFRAQLIRSSIEHLNEWWLAGTDYTRHWMPTGITASARHTDMTNHVLGMGVLGGLPLMFTFLAIVVSAFRSIGRSLRASESNAARFMLWGLGALLFGFVMNFMSITLFDSSVLFFWLTVALIETAADKKPAISTKAPAASVAPVRVDSNYAIHSFD